MKAGWKLLNDPYNPLHQQWVRIPNLLKGLAAGSAYAGTSAVVNDY